MRTTRLTLVHSDFSPHNILIRNGELILLSPQLIHWGDAAFDAGFALAHFTSKAFAGKAHRHVSKGDELLQAALVFWKEYRAQVRTLTWAKGLEARCVRHTLACLLTNTARHETLEYSSKEVRSRQVAFAIAMVKNPPHTVEALTAQMDMQLGA